MTDDITNDLALLDDWLAGKGYGEEAGLCMRAMDLIRKQADEIEKLRAAFKPFADMHDKWWAGGVMFLPMPDEHTVLVEFAHLRKAKEAMNDTH